MFQSGKGTTPCTYILSCEASLPVFVSLCLRPAQRIPTCNTLTAPSLPPSLLSSMPCFLFFPSPHYPPCGLCLSTTHCTALNTIVFTNTFQGLFQPKQAAAGWVLLHILGHTIQTLVGKFSVHCFVFVHSSSSYAVQVSTTLKSLFILFDPGLAVVILILK